MLKLEAKVKSSVQTNLVIAFGGKEFVKYEWRPVPREEKIERQAQDHPLLITQEMGKIKKVAKRAKKEVIEKAEAEE